MHLDTQAVGQKPHHRGRFDPGNLFQLLLSLEQWDKEDVAADVAALAKDLYDLGVADILRAGDLDVIAGIEAETPGARAVEIGGRKHPRQGSNERYAGGNLLEPVGGFLGKGAAADRNALLAA